MALSAILGNTETSDFRDSSSRHVALANTENEDPQGADGTKSAKVSARHWICAISTSTICGFCLSKDLVKWILDPCQSRAEKVFQKYAIFCFRRSPFDFVRDFAYPPRPHH